MSEFDLAWVAGFIDAEGSFVIREQRSRKDVHVISTIVCVAVSQAEPRTEILFWLRDKFGGGVYNHHRPDPTKAHNKALRWALNGAKAVDFCRLISPYLVLKKRQAQLVVEHQMTKFTYNPEKLKGHQGRPRVDPEILVLRQAQILEMKGLNARGVWNRKTEFYGKGDQSPIPLSDLQCSWLGGFIDGDGCISVNAVKMGKSGFRGETRGTVSHISIVQSEPRTWILRWLNEVVGGYLCEIKHDLKNVNHSRALSLSFSGQDAVDLATKLLPHFRLKKRNAEIIIEHQELKNTIVGTQSGSLRTDFRVSGEMMTRRKAHVDECAQLNKRGTKND